MSQLAGKTLVFTGTLEMKRDAATATATKAGAKVTGSISGKTDIVVVGASAGSTKVDAARAKGTAVWTEAEFVAAAAGKVARKAPAAAAPAAKTPAATKRAAAKAEAVPKAATKKTAAAPKAAAVAAGATRVPQNQVVKCPKGHPLVSQVASGTTFSAGFFCDVCATEINVGDQVVRCNVKKCDFDICPGCARDGLRGKTVVFTGTMKMKRADATTMAVNAGAKVTGSVSTKTNYLVVGSGGKQDTAKTAKSFKAVWTPTNDAKRWTSDAKRWWNVVRLSEDQFIELALSEEDRSRR